MRIIKSDEEVLIEFNKGKVAQTRSRNDDSILVDLDADGNVLSIELIGAPNISAADLLGVLQEFGLDQRLVLETPGPHAA